MALPLKFDLSNKESHMIGTSYGFCLTKLITDN